MVKRMLVVSCDDWEVACTGTPAHQPAVVVLNNHVVAVTAAAKKEGVVAGLRRREAQARCPELQVLPFDPGLAARRFEVVVATLEAIAHGVEMLHAGCCAVATRGPSRYFGGDEALVQHVVMLVEEALRHAQLETRCRVGISEGVFAATLAARQGVVVPAKGAARFLAPQSVDTLSSPDLVDLLRRLGIRTLGDLAALPVADVVGRFGHPGEVAHARARGEENDFFYGGVHRSDLVAETHLDPPAQRHDAVAFAAKALADELHRRLSSEGLACSAVSIEVETENGESLQRLWRHDGMLSATAIADRARWQLEGWSPTSGVVLLRFVPEGLGYDNGHQLGFWGGERAADERAGRALVRVQGLLGHDEVFTAVRAGGRGLTDQVKLIPWGDSSDVVAGQSDQPWPGRLPSPAPATVYTHRPLARLTDRAGNDMSVDGRGLLNGVPALININDRSPLVIEAWAGPWPVDQHWWDDKKHQRQARFQVITSTGQALLVVLEGGKWWVEALYD